MTANPASSNPPKKPPSSDELIEAVKWVHTGSVLAFLKEGTDPNGKNKWGDTALMWAAWEGHTDIAQILIGAGARVNERGYQGETALMRAARYGRKKAANLLIDKGADLSIKNDQGDTALAIAEKAGHTEIAQILKSISDKKIKAAAAAKEAEEARIKRVTSPAVLRNDLPAPKPFRTKPTPGKNT